MLIDHELYDLISFCTFLNKCDALDGKMVSGPKDEVTKYKYEARYSRRLYLNLYASCLALLYTLQF